MMFYFYFSLFSLFSPNCFSGFVKEYEWSSETPISPVSVYFQLVGIFMMMHFPRFWELGFT
jgi:hypothetical protein